MLDYSGGSVAVIFHKDHELQVIGTRLFCKIVVRVEQRYRS